MAKIDLNLCRCQWLKRGVCALDMVETVSTVSTGCRKPLKRFLVWHRPNTPLKPLASTQVWTWQRLTGGIGCWASANLPSRAVIPLGTPMPQPLRPAAPLAPPLEPRLQQRYQQLVQEHLHLDRKSTRLNSSH